MVLLFALFLGNAIILWRCRGTRPAAQSDWEQSTIPAGASAPQIGADAPRRRPAASPAPLPVLGEAPGLGRGASCLGDELRSGNADGRPGGTAVGIGIGPV